MQVWSRFFPAMLDIRRAIESGVIGEVRHSPCPPQPLPATFPAAPCSPAPCRCDRSTAASARQTAQGPAQQPSRRASTARRLQPSRDRGCNPTCSRLQPYVLAAVAPCTGGCDPTCSVCPAPHVTSPHSPAPLPRPTFSPHSVAPLSRPTSPPSSASGLSEAPRRAWRESLTRCTRRPSLTRT